MNTFQVVVMNEKESKSSAGYQAMWLASVVVVRMDDGRLKTIKNRFDYPGNKNAVAIRLPDEI